MLSKENQEPESDQKQNDTPCECSMNCCEYAKMYNICNLKLKSRVEEILILQEQINVLNKQRNLFEKNTKQRIFIESANAVILIFNILNNIINNNQISDLKDIKDNAMFNACKIALNQIDNIFHKLSIQIIKPTSNDKFDAKYHNAISVTSKENLEDQAIAYLVEPGFYYKRNDQEEVLIKPAIVIINIKS